MFPSLRKDARIVNAEEGPPVKLFNDQCQNHGIMKPVVAFRWFNWSIMTYFGPSKVHHHQRTLEVWRFQTPGFLFWNGEVISVDFGDAIYIWPGNAHAAKPDKWPVVTFDRFSIPDYSSTDDILDEPGYDW